MKLTLIIFSIALSALWCRLPAHADAAASGHKSISAISTGSLVERLAFPGNEFPHSSRSGFHLATQSSCDAAQAQCVAACNNQSGTAQQNCISDCNDVRSTCQ